MHVQGPRVLDSISKILSAARLAVCRHTAPSQLSTQSPKGKRPSQVGQVTPLQLSSACLHSWACCWGWAPQGRREKLGLHVFCSGLRVRRLAALTAVEVRRKEFGRTAQGNNPAGLKPKAKAVPSFPFHIEARLPLCELHFMTTGLGLLASTWTGERAGFGSKFHACGTTSDSASTN